MLPVFFLALLATPIQGFDPFVELAPLVASLGLDEVAGNAEGAALALIAMGESARAPLSVALSDTDPQRRFLAAWALAYIGPEDHRMSLTCRTLIPHLGGDRIYGNGLMAVGALQRIGLDALPYLISAQDEVDAQAELAIAA